MLPVTIRITRRVTALLSLLLLLVFLLTCPVLVLAQRAVPATPAGCTMTFADLDGDGRADLVFSDIDGDGLTDIVTLSQSRTKHDTVKNSINNLRGIAPPELELDDLDGDGQPDFALVGARELRRGLKDSSRSQLSIVRREVAGRNVLGIEALIASGWLAPGAANGDPLAHLVPSCPGPVGGPIPIPYPDPGNPGTGGGTGGGVPTSTGNDAGTVRGIITRP